MLTRMAADYRKSTLPACHCAKHLDSQRGIFHRESDIGKTRTMGAYSLTILDPEVF
jgi:hypothetical protein